jgi:hypothetical protein
VTGMSWKWQLLGWIFMILLNGGLLFYVYLFAITQTHSRQSAWFESFVMWLVFEVVVSSTGLVLLTHLFIPLYVLKDISRIKESVLKDLTIFRESYLRSPPRDIEEGEGARNGDQGTEGNKDFNAAKYLFPSWRLASLFPDIPESGLILLFKTPCPKRKFGEKGAAVSREYEQALILTALSRILLFFLGSLLHFHTLVQDIFLQTVCNSGFGIVGLWLIRLFAIHPVLPVAVSVMLLLLLAWLLRLCSSMGKNELVSITPSHLEEPSPLVSLREQVHPSLVQHREPRASSPLSPTDLSMTSIATDQRVEVSSGIGDHTFQMAEKEQSILVWSDDEGSQGGDWAYSPDRNSSSSSSDSKQSDEAQVIIRRVRWSSFNHDTVSLSDSTHSLTH